jgi:hypothetical protein
MNHFGGSGFFVRSSFLAVLAFWSFRLSGRSSTLVVLAFSKVVPVTANK